MSDLETFAPEPREVTIEGKDLKILPVRLKDVPRLARFTTPMQALLLTGNWAEVLDKHTDDMAGAIAVGTGEDIEWAADLYLDDAVKLLGEVLDVNADFFVRHVLPAVGVASTKLTETIQKSLGERSLPGSSNGGTEPKTASS